MELTKDELQVLSAYLDCNPCEAGCAIEEMDPGKGKDCDECQFKDISWKLRIKIWNEMDKTPLYWKKEMENECKAESKETEKGNKNA